MRPESKRDPSPATRPSILGWTLIVSLQAVTAASTGLVWLVATGSDVSAASTAAAPSRAEGEGRHRGVIPRTTRPPWPAPPSEPEPKADTSAPLVRPVQERRRDDDALTMRSVVEAVRAQAGTIKPCLRTAIDRDEIERGKPYQLLLAWKIMPNGNVVSPRLVSPAKLQHSSLAACMRSKMERWRFEPSAKGAPVSNYPFGPFIVR